MATYKKPLVTTTVTVHGVDDPVVFADTVGEDGRVARDGSNARAQILAYKTIVSSTDDGTIVIPYHAVIMAVVTVEESDDITKPEDAFCVAES